MSQAAHIERFDDVRREHRWHVVTENGEIISGSSEGYEKSADREHAIKLTLQALVADYGVPGMRQMGYQPVGSEERVRLRRYQTQLTTIMGELKGIRTLCDVQNIRDVAETAILHLQDACDELAQREEGL